MPESNSLIQGAARGIGLGLVERLLDDTNGHVFATARDPDSATELQALGKHYGERRLTIMSLDITNEQTIVDARRRVAAQAERLDLLITCTGILHDAHGHEVACNEYSIRDFGRASTVPPLVR